MPVLESVTIHVRRGGEQEFEASAKEATALLRSSRGCLGTELRRGLELPSTYLLLVWWSSLDDHLVGFRQGPLYEHFRALMSPHYEAAPDLYHFSDPVGIEER